MLNSLPLLRQVRPAAPAVHVALGVPCQYPQAFNDPLIIGCSYVADTQHSVDMERVCSSCSLAHLS
jgi:hypothetical protein